MSTRSLLARPRVWLFLAIGGLLAAIIVFPATGAQQRTSIGNTQLGHMSQSVAVRYWLTNPDQAPSSLRALRALLGRSPDAATRAAPPPTEELFNRDNVGLPQNEESIVACRSRPNIVLGGTNDYRYLLDPEENSTGWHFSTDGGATVRNEGLLPSIDFGGGVRVPSGGDPVSAADADCNLYAGDLNYDPADLFPNGIGVYRSDPATLASCPGGGSDPACWPKRKVVATAPDESHFLDKEWMDVGQSGSAGRVVWVSYTDFTTTGPGPTDFVASIFAVRCSASLSDCTKPIKISDGDKDVQFSDVTIGPDGRTYITWSEIKGELEGTPQTFIHKLRIAPAGSTNFGPTRVIYAETQPIPFGGFLHANDFRVATVQRSVVRMMGNGEPRIYVVWDSCAVRLLGETSCQEPRVKLSYSDNDGRRWSDVKVLSVDGDNYFPTIADDPAGANLAVAWYTNRRDTLFHNQQDVELATITPDGAVTKRQFIAKRSNETEADPLLGGVFIGDYFEVFANKGTAYVHYNANYRQVKLLGEGFPIPQQDNFLARRQL